MSYPELQAKKKAYHGLTGKDYTQQYLYSEGIIVMNNNTF